MAYNPDAIVKLKHLNEFARQLNIKLDGGIDPKLERPYTTVYFKMNGSTASYPGVPDDGVINLKLSELPNDGARLGLWITINNTDPNSSPNISNIDFGDNPFNSFSLTFYNNAYQQWDIRVRAERKIAGTYKYTLLFPETDTYQAYNLNLTFNVTDD